jgi:hypothetical protein
MVQAWLTGAAILVSVVVILWELGAPPRLRLAADSGPGAGKVHLRLHAEARERPIQGLRLEIRLPRFYPLEGPDRLETVSADGWQPVWQDDSRAEILGWNLVKSRLEPGESLELIVRRFSGPHLALPHPNEWNVRWWSERTGPTSVTVRASTPVDGAEVAERETMTSRGS